jgi:prepilin-type N-terminal cleavage/methylation domain-containing protein
LKKEGYTITELLAVLVILGILISIGVTAYNGIKKDVLETNYQNIVSLIKNAAVKYGNDTEDTLTNVDTLIKLGYLKADDESGNIYDPRDNSILNCHTISITYDGENYVATFNDSISVDENKKCILNNNSIINIVCYDESNNKVNCDSWIKDNKKLEANLTTNDYIDSNKYDIQYYWSSYTGATSEKNTILTNVNKENILNTQYKIVVNILDKTTKEVIKTDSKSVRVKIDKQGPTIVDVKQDGSNFTINASDLNGIGLNDNGYGMGTTCQNNSNNVIGQNNLEGKVKVCATDKLGNVGSMDITIPTLNIATSDNVATGIIHTNPYSLTFKGSADTTKIYYGTTENNLDKEVSGTSAVINNITDNNTYYAKACSEKYCSPVKSYKSLYGVLATASVSQFEWGDSTYNGSINVGNNVLAIKSIKVTSPYGGSASVTSINGPVINYKIIGGTTLNRQKSEPMTKSANYQNKIYDQTVQYSCSSINYNDDYGFHEINAYLDGSVCNWPFEYVYGHVDWSCAGVPDWQRGDRNPTTYNCPYGYTKMNYEPLCGNETCPKYTSTSCYNECQKDPTAAEVSYSTYSYCPSGTSEYNGGCYSCGYGETLSGSTCYYTHYYTDYYYAYALSIEYYK